MKALPASAFCDAHTNKNFSAILVRFLPCPACLHAKVTIQGIVNLHFLAGIAEAAAAVGNGIPAEEEPPKVLYRVPAHAAWFKYDQIHANELRGVPDYFAGEPMKTPRASPSKWDVTPHMLSFAY